MMNTPHKLHRSSNVTNLIPVYGHTATTARLTHWLSTGLLLLVFVLAGCGSTNTGTTTGSSAPTPPSSTTNKAPSTTPSAAATDWTTYHHDNTRAGSIVTTPDPHSLTSTWSVQLDGAVYAEPLVVGTHVFVATEGDSLYSLDSQTGKQQWRTHVGTPVPLSTLPCGNIDPLGITGTPVYDPATGLIFAVAEITGPHHILVGIDAKTGQVRVRRSVDIAGMDARAHQQRAALALSHGMVYVAYGGLDGDCSDYIGKVVASRTDGTGSLLSYQVPTAREAGIWAASGPAVDGSGNIYVAVGNGASTGGNWDHSDSVLRLSPTLQLEDGFAPSGWPQENAADADLGSMGPLLMPNALVFADGKSGQGYLLHAGALGGVGGQAVQASICRSFGGAAALYSQIFVPCTDGIREVRVGSGPTMTIGWHAPSRIAGSPIVGGHTVYSMDTNGGTLYALATTNGSIRASLQVGQTSRFATPTLSGNQIFIGTMQGIVAVKLA